MTSYQTHLSSLKWISQEYYGENFDKGIQYLSNYVDLNGSHFDVLDEPPTPLEFSRISHISRPVLIKGSRVHLTKGRLLTLAGADIKATKARWTNEYLENAMEDRPISVAVTPNGCAYTLPVAHFTLQPPC